MTNKKIAVERPVFRKFLKRMDLGLNPSSLQISRYRLNCPRLPGTASELPVRLTMMLRSDGDWSLQPLLTKCLA